MREQNEINETLTTEPFINENFATRTFLQPKGFWSVDGA